MTRMRPRRMSHVAGEGEDREPSRAGAVDRSDISRVESGYRLTRIQSRQMQMRAIGKEGAGRGPRERYAPSVGRIRRRGSGCSLSPCAVAAAVAGAAVYEARKRS